MQAVTAHVRPAPGEDMLETGAVMEEFHKDIFILAKQMAV
jgi:hypothetical protein